MGYFQGEGYLNEGGLMIKRKIRMKEIIIFWGIILALSSGFIPGAADGKEIKILRIGIGVDADTLNPLETTTALHHNIYQLIHDSLTTITPEGKVVPHMAENYSVSEDGMTWTVRLKKGIKFSDGSPLTSHALKLHIDALLNPKIRVPLRVFFLMIKETTVVDDYTFKVHLKEPYAPFDSVLFLILPLPQKILEEYDADKLRRSPIVAGPYKLAEWVKGERIVLVRNENYWGKKPTVEKLVYMIVPDTLTRVAMLRTGDLDFAYSPTPADISALEADPKIKVARPPSPRTIFVGMNTQKGHTRDKLVRQAFNYAVDKHAIAQKLMFGVVKPMDAPMSPVLFGYAPMKKQYNYDPEKAKALLKEANFPRDATIRLIAPTGRYMFDKQVVESVRAYLQDVGVKIEVQVYDWPTLMAMWTKPLDKTEIELYLGGWGPPYLDADVALLMLFSSSAHPPRSLGATFYTNLEFDRLVGMARQTLDPAKRRDLYEKAAELLWDEAPCIWLHVEPYTIAYRSDLKGVVILPIERMFPTYVTKD